MEVTNDPPNLFCLVLILPSKKPDQFKNKKKLSLTESGLSFCFHVHIEDYMYLQWKGADESLPNTTQKFENVVGIEENCFNMLIEKKFQNHNVLNILLPPLQYHIMIHTIWYGTAQLSWQKYRDIKYMSLHSTMFSWHDI